MAKKPGFGSSMGDKKKDSGVTEVKDNEKPRRQVGWGSCGSGGSFVKDPGFNPGKNREGI